MYENLEKFRFFVYNNIRQIQRYSFVLSKIINSYKYNSENRIWTLGDFPLGLRVSPHYFGKIKAKDKNKVTKFFITSNFYRNYSILISATEKLKDENINFEVVVIGKFKTFSNKKLPEKLRKNFKFKYKVSYLELYKEVFNCDYIIINLDPIYEGDLIYLTTKVTGSISLVYGFFKPAIIHTKYAKKYNLTLKNSFIYNFGTSNIFFVLFL